MPIEPPDTSQEGSPLPDFELLGERYELKSQIGRGGMGVVYRARDLALGRDVAIKVMRDATHPGLRTRFLREAQLASRVHHPHTVYVVDFGPLPDGGFFLAMELLDGWTLAATLAACATMPPLRVCRIGSMLASGLQEIHRRGIVHRDLKPANVFLLDKAGAPDFVKIVDFGLAREGGGLVGDATGSGATSLEPGNGSDAGERSAALTREGTFVGTPRYMAPEQLRGEPLDGRADQYALGCVLYELLTGQPPFQGSVDEMAHGHLYGKLVPPRQLQPRAGISPALEEVVLRAMSRRRERRFAEVGLLAAALDAEAERLLRRQPRVTPWWQKSAAGLLLAATGWVLGTHLMNVGPGPVPPLHAAQIPAAPAGQDPAPAAPPPGTALPQETAAPPAAPLRSSPPPLFRHGAPRRPSAEPTVATLLAQADVAAARKQLSEAQQLLESIRSRCKRPSGPPREGSDGCAAAAVPTALHLGRLYEARGQWAEALSEYSRALGDTSSRRPADPAQSDEAQAATARLIPRLGRVILTRMRNGRCEEVPLFLPPGEHQLEVNGQMQSIFLKARETRRLGSCPQP